MSNHDLKISYEDWAKYHHMPIITDSMGGYLLPAELQASFMGIVKSLKLNVSGEPMTEVTDK